MSCTRALLLVLVATSIGSLDARSLAGTKNAGVYISQLRCELDPKVNVSTFASYKDEIQGLWESFCAINRGIFTMTPGDNKTYSCGNLPAAWKLDNIGNLVELPPAQGVEILSQYIQAVFNTSSVKSADTCDFHSLAVLTCANGTDTSRNANQPWKTAPWAEAVGAEHALRSVNMGGLFMLEPWITPDLFPWSLTLRDEYTLGIAAQSNMSIKKVLTDHWENWYTSTDFQQMKSFNLDAVRLPVGWWFFAKEAGLDAKPYTVPDVPLSSPDHPLTKVIKALDSAGMAVILDLHGAPGSQNGLDNSGRRSTNTNPEEWGETWEYNQTAQDDTTAVVKAMATYINQLNAAGLHKIIALELLNEPWVFNDLSIIRDWYMSAIAEVRTVNQTLPIMIHDAFRHLEWSWLLKRWPAELLDRVVLDTHLYQAFNTNDIASQGLPCDQSKMVAHEDLGCNYGSMYRFKTCTSLPTFTGEFSLAIDNCQPGLQGHGSYSQFQDFGQCENVEAHTGPWWDEHFKSFAMRQIATFERELGWSFWSFKLDDTAESAPTGKLWSFRRAVAAGYIDTTYPQDACLHQLGDQAGC